MIVFDIFQGFLFVFVFEKFYANVILSVFVFDLVYLTPTLHTRSISIPTCVYNVVKQLFIEYLNKQYNTFSIVKYAKTDRHMRLLTAH